jgi:hypothetical protein
VTERATAAEVGLLCEEAFLGTMHLAFVKLESGEVLCETVEQL